MNDLANVLSAIEALHASAGGASESFIEVRDVGQEIVLGGNRAGLLQIALYALSLADRVEGAHVHLDAHSGADVADRPLVLRRSAPEWSNSNSKP
jgi:hypothetical protein